MDSAKALIRTVLRAFYETRSTILIDALMLHVTLRDDDLAFVMGMQVKELRKLCGKLKEDRLLQEGSRPEIREGGLNRPSLRTYYYIDYRAVVDSIKYRIYKLTKSVEGDLRPADQHKDFICPQCKSRWTILEVMDNINDRGEFLCHRCNYVLQQDEEKEESGAGHVKQSRLMSQLDSLLSLLQKIDDQFVPETIFNDDLINSGVRVERNQLTNPMAATHVVANSFGPVTVKGMAQPTAKVNVDLTTSSEKSAADAAAEKAHKEKLAAQNVLPEWHTTSTVSGERVNPAALESPTKHTASSTLSQDTKGGIATGSPKDEDGPGEDAAVQEYYRQLEKEQAEKQRKDQEEEEEEEDEEEEDDEDDEDEDGFEDVDVTDTPASSGAIPNGAPLSSASGSASATPNGHALLEKHDPGSPKQKRVKLDPNIASEAEVQQFADKENPNIKVEDSEEDEDEGDFVDV